MQKKEEAFFHLEPVLSGDLSVLASCVWAQLKFSCIIKAG